MLSYIADVHSNQHEGWSTFYLHVSVCCCLLHQGALVEQELTVEEEETASLPRGTTQVSGGCHCCCR